VYDRALRRHDLRTYPGPVLIFHSTDARCDQEDRTLWEVLEAGYASTVRFDATHTQFVRDPELIAGWAECLAERLAELDSAAGAPGRPR
jgi:hypothetical protein